MICKVGWLIAGLISVVGWSAAANGWDSPTEGDFRTIADGEGPPEEELWGDPGTAEAPPGIDLSLFEQGGGPVLCGGPGRRDRGTYDTPPGVDTSVLAAEQGPLELTSNDRFEAPAGRNDRPPRLRQRFGGAACDE